MSGEDPFSGDVRTWSERLAALSLGDRDRACVAATEGARASVIALGKAVYPSRESRDLFNACAALGRILANEGASPTLVAAMLDPHVVPFGRDVDDRAARAALHEGYESALLAKNLEKARAAWEFPSCAVRLDDATYAVRAFFPEADREDIDAWCERTTTALIRARARRVLLEGDEPIRSMLEEKLESVGIKVAERIRMAWYANRSIKDRR